jgi:hypothetical protein
MLFPVIKLMAKPLLVCIALMIAGFNVVAQQRVGIGTQTPVAKLDLLGIGNFPAIPGPTSTGVLRIGINSIEGIDIGKMPNFPYSGWIQSGYNGVIVDPLVLQPLGGTVSIGTVNASPAESALLELKSTTQGFLPPRLTFAQRNNIVNPAVGLLLYCKDCGYLGQLQVYNGYYWESMMGTLGDDLLEVGDSYGNATVFYIFQPGDPGYVAGETHGFYVGVTYSNFSWGCYGLAMPGADGTALGTGQQNNIDMMNGCAESTAADACAAFGGFLPSKDELLLLKNSGYMPIVNLCVPPYYLCKVWTSSEIDANSAWALNYATGTMVVEPKNNFDGNIIPIGSF